jgi:hypothetical protein
MDSSFSPKDEIWFLRVCHHISNAVYCLGIPERGWEDAQEDLKEVEWIGVDWIHLAPDRDKRQQ